MDDNGELSVRVDPLPLKITPELKGMEDFIVRRYVMEEAKRDIRRSYLRYVAMGRKEKTLKGMTDRPFKHRHNRFCSSHGGQTMRRFEERFVSLCFA